MGGDGSFKIVHPRSRDAKALGVDGQRRWGGGVLKIRQFSWKSYMYRPLVKFWAKDCKFTKSHTPTRRVGFNGGRGARDTPPPILSPSSSKKYKNTA